jgi:hypothetical protein
MKIPVLQACPFCGSVEALEVAETMTWWVTCEPDHGGCGANGPGDSKSRKEAIAAWNRRLAPLPIDQQCRDMERGEGGETREDR